MTFKIVTNLEMNLNDAFVEERQLNGEVLLIPFKLRTGAWLAALYYCKTLS